jgi:hypothetical protein
VKEELARGDFARLAYRLGRVQATGVLTIEVPRARTEVLILRRGQLITTESDATGRTAQVRLTRIASFEGASWSFDGGTAAYPPGASGRQVSLAAWARQHLESQIDNGRGDRLIAELAGVRLAIRPEHAPEALDDSDRRMIAAMSQPRRIDQIWPLARTPRFRLLAFLHFLRTVGALQLTGIASEDSAPHRTPAAPVSVRAEALRRLGLEGDAPREVVKRAYRRLARALHPDLQPGISDARKRELESKLAEVSAAYAHVLAL